MSSNQLKIYEHRDQNLAFTCRDTHNLTLTRTYSGLTYYRSLPSTMSMNHRINEKLFVQQTDYSPFLGSRLRCVQRGDKSATPNLSHLLKFKDSTHTHTYTHPFHMRIYLAAPLENQYFLNWRRGGAPSLVAWCLYASKQIDITSLTNRWVKTNMYCRISKVYVVDERKKNINFVFLVSPLSFIKVSATINTLGGGEYQGSL